MFVYFKSENLVLTCEFIPQLLSVEYIKQNGLENICNRWEKLDTMNGTFRLSFVPVRCNCDNSQYVHYDDYNDYECYHCGITKWSERLYLQNSGSLDILCADKYNDFCELCEVTNYPNTYKWHKDDNLYVLHISDKRVLSDKYIENIDNSCHITFVDSLHNL